MRKENLQLGVQNSRGRFLNDGGSLLIVVLLVSLLFMAAIISYQGWSYQASRGGVHRLSTTYALSYAEGGLSKAMDTLRMPQTSGALAPGGSTTLNFPFAKGFAAVTLIRNINDTSLVNLVSTGYYQLAGVTLQAVIDADIHVRCMADFFAVVPNTLQITQGTDLSQADVYAKDLIFQMADYSAAPIKIRHAFYSGSVQPSGPIPTNPVTNQPVVQFGAAPFEPQRLSAEANLTPLDSSIRSRYSSWAGSDILTAGQNLTGTLSPPANSYGIYFCPGDLGLGSSSDLNVNGNSLIYSAGTVTIKGNIQLANPSSWLAVIAEKGIILDPAAPANLTVNATLVTGGYFNAPSPIASRSGGQLSFTGGFQAQAGASLGSGWPSRVYAFHRPPDAMLLPFLLTVDDYSVVQGKYNQ